MTDTNWGSPLSPAAIAATNSNYRMQVLDTWQEAKKALDAAKAAEAAARNEVVKLFSEKASDPMAEGTENIATGVGTVKFKHTLNYKLDTSNDGDKLDKVLDAIEKSMEGGNIIAERLVKWKPELSISEYRLLSPENKKRIDAVLTVTPGAKSVEIVPIKGA